MSEQLEALQRRTRSVQGIRSVVHTMKTLSAVNVTPNEQAAMAITGYLDVVLMGLQALLQVSSIERRRAKHAPTHRLVMALGTDHGLCGNYNARVARRVAQTISNRGDGSANQTYQLVCVGARLDDALNDLDLTSTQVLFTPSNVDGLIRLSGDLVAHVDRLSQGLDRDAITVQMVYTEPLGHGQQETVTKTLLPVPHNELSALVSRQWPSRCRPWFRQSQQSLLTALLRNFLFASVCRGAADAMQTENAARLSRMRQAEDAVDEQLSSLTTQTRSARQSRITEELQDVIAGFEAVKDSNDGQPRQSA